MAEERLEEIRQARLGKRAAMLERGEVPYPAEARRSHTGAEFLEQFETLQADSVPVTLTGRIVSVRTHGSIAFVDIADFAAKVQLQLTQDDVPEEIFARLAALDAGDFIQASGEAAQSKRGSNVLRVGEFHILSKSIRPLPKTWFGLKDVETRYRQREVDLLLTEKAKEILRTRSRVLAWLREDMQRRGFIEVETPILQPIAGGALARPFATHHQALDMELYLRIAPELYLKRLLVGGFEKIFELGRNFRNEGIDREHNPEFTMCELYWAYADYEDLMDMTEELLSSLAATLSKNDWEKPWRRERFVDKMSELTGFDVAEKQSPEEYIPLFATHNLELPHVRTYPKLLDALYKELWKPQLTEPTIVYDFPLPLAPLAKAKVVDARIAEKFQVVAQGVELVNAYTELNDPVEQRERFMVQQQQRDAGDEEIGKLDEAYLRALEYGMPPAAGWGLGVDRLVALLTEAGSIRETISFPLLKKEHD
ncbi:MAG TPA: lysine--tRNA ligase [Candidatus Andersenbacteria bacterium]|nr:lysine--tRNA ligase [Candidatus Andersenbacteria bacterium]